jgi:glycosyltransferase involved in cell wall biosynthesis
MKEKVKKGYAVHPIVIRSGVDLDKFQAINDLELIRGRNNIDKDTFLLLTVNIPLPHRRIEDVIQALSTLRKRGRNVKFLWIGLLTYHTEYTKYITSLIKKLQIEKDVILANAVPETEMSLYYHACDVFIFPNEEQTWGLAVTEAMACQKPVIVSTGAGVHEVLKDYQTALLIPPRRPDLLVEKVEELMNDFELRVRIAKMGYEFVQQNLSWKRYAESMIDVFKEVLKQENSL